MTAESFKRKSLRFPADEGTLVQIDIKPSAKKFSPTIVGLALNEASKGCGAVIVKDPEIIEGMTCKIKVGLLSPLMAEIRWVKELDPQVLKIGVFYLE